MAHTYVTNMQHYLNDEGLLIQNIPKPAYNIATYLGKIIEAVTSRRSANENYSTKVECRRRPGHKKCIGEIVAFIDKEDGQRIRWFCPFCEDNGYISGWQGTRWDRGKIIYHRF